MDSYTKTNLRQVIAAQFDGYLDMIFTEVSSPVYSGGAETDEIYQVGDLSALDPTALGVTWCNDAATTLCLRPFRAGSAGREFRGRGRWARRCLATS